MFPLRILADEHLRILTDEQVTTNISKQKIHFQRKIYTPNEPWSFAATHFSIPDLDN